MSLKHLIISYNILYRDNGAVDAEGIMRGCDSTFRCTRFCRFGWFSTFNSPASAKNEHSAHLRKHQVARVSRCMILNRRWERPGTTRSSSNISFTERVCSTSSELSSPLPRQALKPSVKRLTFLRTMKGLAVLLRKYTQESMEIIVLKPGILTYLCMHIMGYPSLHKHKHHIRLKFASLGGRAFC